MQHFKGGIKINICVIPARGGSKRIPRKNIKEFNGKPIIAYSIEAALKSNCFDKVIVSTDDDEIIKVAKKYGADVPFIRPADLATDSASSVDVCINMLEYYQNQGINFKLLNLLEPTSPLTTARDIMNAFDMLIGSHQGRSLVGVGEAVTPHPRFLCSISKQGLLKPLLSDPDNGASNLHVRRQDLNSNYYFYDGSIYLSYTYDLLKMKSFYHENTLCKIFSKFQNFEIDDEDDFKIIEAIVNR